MSKYGAAKAGWGKATELYKAWKRNKSSKKLFKDASGGMQHPVIDKVTPTLTKGESTGVKLHKFKMKIKKGSDDAEDAIRTGVKKFKTSIDKMKDPK